MMYFSANGWQAILYALVAGLEAGVLLMAATWLKHHCRRGIGMITDTLCGMGIAVLFAHALWQGTEGSFHPYMAAAMFMGMILFRVGPQALLEAVIQRIRS